jgi:LDH2 family malate/lactate/ureidoglycolate dehydrogenase
MRNQGVVLILMRDDLFSSTAEFGHRADEMATRTRAIAPAPGFQSVLVPGDPEWNARQERQADGIPIEDAVWEELAALPR